VTPLASAFQEKVLYQGAAHSQRGAALVAAAPLLSRWLKQLLATGLQFNATMAKNAEAMGERLAELTSRLMSVALPMGLLMMVVGIAVVVAAGGRAVQRPARAATAAVGRRSLQARAVDRAADGHDAAVREPGDGRDLAHRPADEHLRGRFPDHAGRRPGGRAADAADDAGAVHDGAGADAEQVSVDEPGERRVIPRGASSPPHPSVLTVFLSRSCLISIASGVPARCT